MHLFHNLNKPGFELELKDVSIEDLQKLKAAGIKFEKATQEKTDIVIEFTFSCVINVFMSRDIPAIVKDLQRIEEIISSRPSS